MSEEDEEYIKDVIQLNYHCQRDRAVEIISRKETEYQREKREIVGLSSKVCKFFFTPLSAA